ncbi:conserved hypothetical protein [Hyella patelloides LEGE 07179]|uniref:Uncharacterized protein n=1 Tax=Hyella patelloides LEGE 07179 TaxID=945734 RepID=A0A563W0H3_9CYAN|nr:DUF3086 domain-containing protein [Hyella patelloides]VEP17181.1 conserved hypothetical protein [Hyella patelloides LEGE 07179]
MNSERPQNPKSDFPEAFDSDEMEIDVAYEEITPEEQQKIKQEVKKAASSVNNTSEPLSDIWLDDDLEVIDIPQQTDSDDPKTASWTSETDSLESESTKVEQETSLDNSTAKSDDSAIENILDNSKVEATEIKPIVDTIKTESTDSQTEQVLDNLKVNTKEIEPTVDNKEIESSNSQTEQVLDNLETESTEEVQKHTLETELEFNFPETEIKEPEITKTPDEESITEKSTSEPELIADSWLEESEKLSSASIEQNKHHQDLSSQIAELKQQKATLLEEISNLQAQKEIAIAQQTQAIGDSLGRMVQEGTRELKERKNNLLIDIEKLERRRERIRQEMRTNFAGASQDLAVRIQGFKEYLVGSLQDLATAAESLELPKPEERRRPPQRETRATREDRKPRNRPPEASSQPQFTEQAFAEQTRRIRQLLEQYRTRPDYYGSPWQLRRTFEPVHAERVQEWFFSQGGRGAIKGMGSRLQNILVASAVISVLYRLYRDRCRILVLVDTPEKLGEWRRGLQDCLGISRNDFGSNRGVVLFESADVLVQRADRLLEDKLLPLIIIDETEELVNLGLLKFPLWLAFVEKSQPKTSGYLY